MSVFNEFLNHFLKKAKTKENFNDIKVNNLRIVKIYSIVHKDVDENGNQIGLETAKAVPFYVLVEKHNSFYRIIPTANFAPKMDAVVDGSVLHQFVIKKTNRYNRYRKPTTLCPELTNKTLTYNETKALAEKISTINSDFFTQDDVEKETKQLTEICQNFNKMLNDKAKLNEEKEQTL